MAKMIDATILKAKLIGCKAFYVDVMKTADDRAFTLKILAQFVDTFIDEIDSMADGEPDDRT